MIGIQPKINKIPIPNPQIINRPSDQEDITEEKHNPNQKIENINGQDYITEVLNISKIKEGFYIGDKIAAISIEVVVQFKLTHIINASGSQIINQWETIGLKYLTLNWEESPTQSLFDPKDDIADKILLFIEDSFINGEGILAHSFKGQNRVCIVVLIYLMKKYKWSLKKSMEYLKSKKQDVDIPSYFLSQLIKFEARLGQRGELSKDIPWSFDNLKDPEEKLLRNTYINGLNKNKINRSNLNENKGKIKHINWADLVDPEQQVPISVINLDKDLFFKKNIKPIFVHKQLKPLKSCIKKNKNRFLFKYLSNKNIKGEKKDEKNISISNILKNNLINSNVITSGNKICNTSQNEEISNKLINSIPIKNSNINKKLNNFNNPKNNLNEIHTNLEKNIDILKVPKRKGLNINKNYLRNANTEENLAADNQVKISIKNRVKKNNNENIQLNNQQNLNNLYINTYNLSSSNNNKNFEEKIQESIKLKSLNKNYSDNQIKINKISEEEIKNYTIYDEKGININNKIITKNRRKEHSYNRRDDKKENIIIIANNYDNIIKNNINNYYINQIGTINNNINNNHVTNNYNFKNNTFNNSYNNKEFKNSNKIIPIANMKKKSYKRTNDIDNNVEINDIKEFNIKTFNNTDNNKVAKNSIKNILGNNHRQILGINNNNENNIFLIGQNEEINNELESHFIPKNFKADKKVINIINNNNAKRFKIIENSNLKNYNSNDNMLNNKKRNINNNTNINNILENNKKIGRHNHIIITTKKNIKKQTSPNHFLFQITPNINLTTSSNTNLNKYDDPIISNYNPIKKNNRNNRSLQNSRSKNYYNTDTDNNYNMNINNYSISNNKPLNNFNPNLIKRKGTPTAGHQSIKINSINNNPVKIKNNFFSNINLKKPSTPDTIINKSMTMMRNNKTENSNNLFSSNSSINLNKSAIFNNKLKKLKNYNSISNDNINNLIRPMTAPHKGDKEKSSNEKKRKQIIHQIQDNTKGINNFNKNLFKINLRPSSAGPGKNNEIDNNTSNIDKNKEKKEFDSIKNNNNQNSNIIHIGNKLELDLSNKYKTNLGKRRFVSPPIINDNKINLKNNNIKYNFTKQRLPSPMIKSMNSNVKTFISNINRSITNYNYINKNRSFNLK